MQVVLDNSQTHTPAVQPSCYLSLENLLIGCTIALYILVQSHLAAIVQSVEFQVGG